MSAFVRLHPSTFRVMSWKNGLGTTTELVIRPADATLDDFCFRVSIADINASGPFSKFDGIDRIIVQLEGEPMTLTQGQDSTHVLGLLEPYAFAGDGVTDCTLAGPSARDFNVMVRRTLASARVEVFTLKRDQSIEVQGEADRCFVYTQRGRLLVRCGEENVHAAVNEAAIAKGIHRLRLSGDAQDNVAIVVFITLKTSV